MAKKPSTVSRSAKTGKFTIGRTASMRISKVEGLNVTRDMKGTFESFDDQRLTHDARRSALAEKYGKERR